MVYRISSPQRGDVVVFIAPPNATDPSDEDVPGLPPDFIKRLIGAPGDVIVVHAGSVQINGQPYSHSSLLPVLVAAGVTTDSGQPDLQAQPFLKFTPNGVLVNGTKLVSKSELAKLVTGNVNAPVTITQGYTTRNGARVPDSTTAEDPDYDMQLYQGEPLRYDPADQMCRLDGIPIDEVVYQHDLQTPPGPVPAGTYFMMGDNRNDSKDSTIWGPLDKDRVVGKAEYVFWPLTRVRAIH
jgi:signal peptidase I